MKSLLENKNTIDIVRNCLLCNDFENVLHLSPDDYKPNMKSCIEYKFNYNESIRFADVALIEEQTLKYIFEICYKHKTKEENRHEPWFEIDSVAFINNINPDKIIIECIRDHKCLSCKSKIENEINLLRLMEIKKQEQTDEKRERMNMCNEDERTNYLQARERIEREAHRVKLEKERTDLNKGIELANNIIREQKQERERKKIELTRICDICYINYCKCDNPVIVKNKYDKFVCNNCNKRMCKCIRITNFFTRAAGL